MRLLLKLWVSAASNLTVEYDKLSFAMVLYCMGTRKVLGTDYNNFFSYDFKRIESEEGFDEEGKCGFNVRYVTLKRKDWQMKVCYISNTNKSNILVYHWNEIVSQVTA